MHLAIAILILIIVCAVLIPTIGMNVIFLILGAVIAWAIFMRNKSINENINKVPEQTLHIVNVERGGVFELKGVGENYEDLTLTVLAKHLYQEGDFSWYELECDKGSDEKIWVEVEDDDETTVSIVLKKMKLQDIKVTPETLWQIDDNEYGSVYGGYTYEDSGNATFYRFCDDTRAEKLYYWDFVKGNKILSVEKWGETEYEVFLSQKLRPSQITVLRKNEGKQSL